MSAPKTPVIGHVTPLAGATVTLPVFNPTTMRVTGEVEVDASLAVPALDHADDWGDDCPPALDAAGKLNPAAWDPAALRVPQDARSGVAAVFGAMPDLPAPEVLLPGSTWTGPDGTVYDVVRAEDVGDRPRWLVPVGFRGDQVGLEEPGELHTDAAPGGAGMLLALVLRDHRAASDSERRASGAEILARAREHNVIAADELPGVLAAIDEVRNGPEEHRGPAPRFSLESARAMLANLERLPPDVSADDARVDLWVELRAACDEVERLRARVSGLEVDLAAMERRGDAHAEEPSWWRAELARALGLDADALPNSALVGHVHQMARDLAAICKAIETHLPESTRPVESYWLDRVDNASAVIAGARASRDAYQQEARTAERRLTDERSARIDAVQRLERTEATLKRWQARARKAEARVAVLTEERDGLTLRLGQQVRARMQASSTRPGTERRRTPTKAAPVAPAAPLRYRDRVRLTARGMADPKLRRHPRGVFMGAAPNDPGTIFVLRAGRQLSIATPADMWERDDAKPARTRKGGR